MSSRIKVTLAVLLGNILDYYDFLLFAHIGSIVTPYFFPDMGVRKAHILSLFLFGAAFVIRPIGGMIFGYLSDVYGRKMALLNAVKWAIFPALGIGLLPGYETMGIAATCLFVLLRLLQGFSLGGEYTNAGTYLMEYHKKSLGLVSGILVASGTIGSLIGFGFATICLYSQRDMPWLWRVGFLLGGLAAFWSFGMRKILTDLPLPIIPSTINASQDTHLLWLRRLIIIFVGMLVGTTNWLPTTYTNFYVTKIAEEPTHIGLQCTMIALIGYVILSPLFGMLSDRFQCYRRFIKIASLCILPLSFCGFITLQKGHYYFAQIILITASTSFGACIHPFMNHLFPAHVRARNVSLLFTIGLSFGGMSPGIISYCVDKTGLHLIPAFFVGTLSVIMSVLLFVYERQRKAYVLST
jgi:MHS family proline/betaine transporter-like MFS transporter